MPKQVESTAVQFVSVDRDSSVGPFVQYCQTALASSTKRCGLLYGNFVEQDGEMGAWSRTLFLGPSSAAFSPLKASRSRVLDRAGVHVDAVYEPAQDCTPDDLNITEAEAGAQQVDALARRLGLQRVGWIFFRPERCVGQDAFLGPSAPASAH